jgi:hypothetical protein
MAPKIGKSVQAVLNCLLRPAGIEILRRGSSHPHIRRYVSAKKTLNAATKQGISVCDYLESIWHEAGNTQKVIDHMQKLGVFDEPISSICEIGSGSGKFLEKTIARCRPSHYESYEPDVDWASWLAREYGVVSQSCDGYSLAHTSTSSVDLVHAHGVFVYLPFLTTYRYFHEMARVASEGGHIVFDILSEDCLDEVSVYEWLRAEQNYPCILPHRYVLDIFDNFGFCLCGEFLSQLGSGRSRYMVFKRRTARKND